jgi:hypothetical protein
MVVNRLSVLVSGFGVGFSPVHTTLVVVPGCFRTFRSRRLMATFQISWCSHTHVRYHVFGLIGTALSKNISLFQSSFLTVVPMSPNVS